MTESKSLAYNRDLCFQFMQKAKVHSRYPKVSEQVECLPLETHKLFAGAYNPTLNEDGWLVYRFPKAPYTKLGLAKIDNDGDVLSNEEIDTQSTLSAEDPKLFWNNGHCLSWVESSFPKVITASVKWGRFENGKITEIEQPALTGNDGTTCQKNWVLFQRKEQLYAIQWTAPIQKIYWKDKITGAWGIDGLLDSEGPKWPYGQAKGGTAPIEYDGKLLRFFHSRMDNETLTFPIIWRYYIGAYLMEPDPPFKVVAVSKRPIIYGSEIGTVKSSERKNFPQHKVNIVFPGGAIRNGNGWTLAIGENDSNCLLTKITPKELNL